MRDSKVLTIDQARELAAARQARVMFSENPVSARRSSGRIRRSQNR